MKILVATEKPFSKAAVDGIREIVEKAGHTFAALEKYTEKQQLLDAVADADALIVRSDKVTKEVVEAAKNLKIVVRAGAGYDNLDLEACTEHKVVAMNTPGQNSNAVAELAIGMMIMMARGQYDASTGTELKGKTLGIQAYGHIGRIVANIAKGFGMNVLVSTRSISAEDLAKEGVTLVKDVATLYSKCDYISTHIPANAQTKGSIGYDLLTSMPKGACLINTARKEVINEAELLKALQDREDLKYATDIAPANAEELKQFGNRFYATPKKMGAQTKEANANAGFAAANQICDFLATGNTQFQVNK